MLLDAIKPGCIFVFNIGLKKLLKLQTAKPSVTNYM